MINGEKYPFTKNNVDNAPAQKGVYELYRDDECTYIGRAAGEGVTLRSRLQSHFLGSEGPCTKKSSYYKREVNSNPRQREVDLIEEFYRVHGRLPLCNDKWP